MEPTRMYVWNDDERPEMPEERLVVAIADDGSCIAMIDTCDQFDSAFYTLKWDHCAPIPEKKLRLMTRKEIIAWADSVESHGWVVRDQNRIWRSPANYSFFGDLTEYRRARVTRDADGIPVYGEPEPFMIEEEEG